MRKKRSRPGCPQFGFKTAREKDLSDFERRFIAGTFMAGASVWESVQLVCVSIGTVAKVTSAFRSIGMTVTTAWHCGWTHAFNDCECQCRTYHTVSARLFHLQLHTAPEKTKSAQQKCYVSHVLSFIGLNNFVLVFKNRRQYFSNFQINKNKVL